MVQEVLIDTNIWSAHEMGYTDAIVLINDLIRNLIPIRMCTLIEMELLSFSLVDTDEEVKNSREFYLYELAQGPFIEAERGILKVAADIRRKAKNENGKSIKAPDAIIAATALIYDLKLISNNDKDFKWVVENFCHEGRSLNYYNPINDKKDYSDFCAVWMQSKGLR